MGRRREDPWLDRFFTAGVSLVGVVIGAALAVTTTYYFEQRGDTREFRQAARVVDEELRTNASSLWVLYTEDRAVPILREAPEAMFPTDAWTDYRGIVARRASQEAWEQLTIAYLNLRLLKPVLARLEAGTPVPSLYKDRIYDVCHDVQIARESLSGWSERARVGCEAER